MRDVGIKSLCVYYFRNCVVLVILLMPWRVVVFLGCTIIEHLFVLKESNCRVGFASVNESGFTVIHSSISVLTSDV